jgi:Zn-dependent M32 family carboxypeptidase
MMPPGAAESRGAQKSALAGVIYDKKTDKEVGALLEELKKQVGPPQISTSC